MSNKSLSSSLLPSPSPQPIPGRWITLVFGTRETGIVEKRVPSLMTCDSQLISDILEEESDELFIPLPGVPLKAVEPILEYMQHYSGMDHISLEEEEMCNSFDLRPVDKPDILPTDQTLPFCIPNQLCVLQAWDKAFLNKWLDKDILPDIIEGANFLAIPRLVTLACGGIAVLFVQQEDNLEQLLKNLNMDVFDDSIEADRQFKQNLQQQEQIVLRDLVTLPKDDFEY